LIRYGVSDLTGLRQRDGTGASSATPATPAHAPTTVFGSLRTA